MLERTMRSPLTLLAQPGATRTLCIAFLFVTSHSWSAETLPLSLKSSFKHPAETGAYETLIHAVVDLEFRIDPQSQTAEAVLRVDRAGCLAMISWRSGPPSSDDPDPEGSESKPRTAAICITNDTASESELNDWFGDPDSAVGVQPSWVVPLATEGPGNWVLSEDLGAQIFLRGCGSDTYQKYADLLFSAGDLSFEESVNAIGELRIDVNATHVFLDDAEPAAWQLVLEGCDGVQMGLPSEPEPSVFDSLTGTTAFQLPPRTGVGRPTTVISAVSRPMNSPSVSDHVS